jgi:hypothetical protein
VKVPHLRIKCNEIILNWKHTCADPELVWSHVLRTLCFVAKGFLNSNPVIQKLANFLSDGQTVNTVKNIFGGFCSHLVGKSVGIEFLPDRKQVLGCAVAMAGLGSLPNCGITIEPLMVELAILIDVTIGRILRRLQPSLMRSHR